MLAGVDFSGASASVRSAFTGRVGELVDGLPARVWDFTVPLAGSDWRSSSLSLFVSDTAAIAPWLTVNGGLRFEALSGSTDSASNEISWRNLLPRAGVHLAMTDFWQLAAFGQYGRYADRLPLERSRVRRSERADGEDVSMERDERRSCRSRARSVRSCSDGDRAPAAIRRSPPSIRRSSVP